MPSEGLGEHPIRFARGEGRGRGTQRLERAGKSVLLPLSLYDHRPSRMKALDQNGSRLPGSRVARVARVAPRHSEQGLLRKEERLRRELGTRSSGCPRPGPGRRASTHRSREVDLVGLARRACFGRRKAVADAFGHEKGGERFGDELLGVRAGDAKRTM
jgi:hypothetical protein